jgi:hypothetical protein
VFYDPVHYLAPPERKPGALGFAAPLEGRELPVCFGVLRRRLEVEKSPEVQGDFVLAFTRPSPILFQRKARPVGPDGPLA